MADAVLTSIASHEWPHAERCLPDAGLRRETLDASTPPARVLAVSIHDVVDPDVLMAWHDLQAVVTRSDGHDHLPLDRLADEGITAYHLGDYATDAVAEAAIAHMLALLRRHPEATARTRAGTWDRAGLVGRGLQDVRVGVLGVGRIGQAVARRLCAWGVEVVGHDIEHHAAMASLPGFEWASDLGDMLETADVLSIHVPLTAATRGFIDAQRIARLPAGACIVNTARGDVMDQDAVAAALGAGHLDGYAADVLPGEPVPPDLDRFRADPRVVLTPHTGAQTDATMRRRFERTAAIVDAVLADRPGDVAHWRVEAEES